MNSYASPNNFIGGYSLLFATPLAHSNINWQLIVTCPFYLERDINFSFATLGDTPWPATARRCYNSSCRSICWLSHLLPHRQRFLLLINRTKENSSHNSFSPLELLNLSFYVFSFFTELYIRINFLTIILKIITVSLLLYSPIFN